MAEVAADIATVGLYDDNVEETEELEEISDAAALDSGDAPSASIWHPEPYSPTDAEQWRRVVGYSEYMISDRGRLRLKDGTISTVQPGIYVRVCLLPKELGHMISVARARLVAAAFCVRTSVAHSEVDHIDRNPSNDTATNLRWVTRVENRRNSDLVRAGSGRCQPVDQLSLTGEYIRTWPSIMAAAAGTNLHHAVIRNVLSGKTKKPAPYRWRHHEAEDLPDEEWRTIQVKGKSCMVSSMGRVYVYGAKKYGSRTPRNYMMFKGQFVHRLVAMAFHNNPNGLPEVNHINGKHDDNRAVNLEWSTHRDNVAHAYATGLKNTSMRAVLQISLATGEVVAQYTSLASAGREVNRAPENIQAVCKGIKKSSGGYGWRYVQQHVEQEVKPLAAPSPGDIASTITDDELAALLAAMHM